VTRSSATGVAAALLLVAGAAHAQTDVIDLLGKAKEGKTVLTPTPVQPELPPLSRPVDPAEYVVGPGDILQINITGGVTRSWDAMILPEGTIHVPSVGSIALTGLTLVEAKQSVQQRIAREYRGVTIDLRLMRPRHFLVYLAGETPLAGTLEVSAASRASEVLAESLFGPNASRRNVEIRRKTPDGESLTFIDLTRFRLTGYVARDPLLREGDILFVPRATGEVWIEGSVGRAGRYELARGDSLSTLLSLAAGPLPDAAEHGVLVRFADITTTDSLSFRVADVLEGRFDVALRDGDRAYLYHRPRYHYLEQVRILGEVQRPGAYPLLPGFSRLSHLLNAAGGFLPTADMAALRVFRVNPQSGEADPEIDRLTQLGRTEMTTSEYDVLRARVAARRTDFRVDWHRVKPGGDLDFELRSGDVISVDPVVASVRVDGEVRQPGLIRYEPGRKAEDYIRLAGGYSERAQPDKVRIKRAGTGQTILAKDVPALESGDLVWVPERGEPQGWRYLQTTLLVMAQIATILLLFRR